MGQVLGAKRIVYVSLWYVVVECSDWYVSRWFRASGGWLALGAFIARGRSSARWWWCRCSTITKASLGSFLTFLSPLRYRTAILYRFFLAFRSYRFTMKTVLLPWGDRSSPRTFRDVRSAVLRQANEPRLSSFARGIKRRRSERLHSRSDRGRFDAARGSLSERWDAISKRLPVNLAHSSYLFPVHGLSGSLAFRVRRTDSICHRGNRSKPPPLILLPANRNSRRTKIFNNRTRL